MSDDGIHDVCHLSLASQRAELAATLVAERQRLGADYLIAEQVRWLVLPGQKRKTVRIDELRSLVETCDRRAAEGVDR